MNNQYFTLHELSISGFPVPKSTISDITVFGSLFSIGLQMSFTFKDIGDMRTRIPIRGGETVNLKVVDQFDNEVSLQYTLSSFMPLNHSYNADTFYEVKCIESSAFELSTVRTNVYYEDTKVSDVVNGFGIGATTTTQNVSVMNPGWTKNKFVNYLKPLSENRKYGGNYQLFQTFEGIFFKPLGEILDVTSVDTYTYNDRNPFYRYNVLAMEEVQAINYTDVEYNNIKNKTFKQYDENTKTIVTVNKTFSDVNANDTSLGNGLILTEPSRTDTKYEAISYFGDMESPYTLDIESGAYTKKLDVLMNGEFGVVPGTIININIPQRYLQTELDPEMAGLWMVERLSYNLSQTDFKIKARLVKNSVFNGAVLNDGKILRPSTNT